MSIARWNLKEAGGKVQVPGRVYTTKRSPINCTVSTVYAKPLPLNFIQSHPGNGRGTVDAGWERFTCQIGKGKLVGDTFTGIMLDYDHPVASGTYTAYFDDILIQSSSDDNMTISTTTTGENAVVYSNNGIVYIQTLQKLLVSIYNISGQLIFNQKTENPISKQLEKRVYLVKIESEGIVERKSIIVY